MQTSTTYEIASAAPTVLSGCHNHKPYTDKLLVQSGWGPPIDQGWGNFTREPLFVYIPNPNTKDCQYTLSKKTNGDPRCTGCKWKSDQPTREQ